jgi:hypothetical protein
MSYGVVDEGYEMRPGGGVRWREFNPATGVRTTYTLSDGVLIRDTEYVNTELMLENNRDEALSHSPGSRWGDGKIYARVPMNIASTGYLGDASKAGDRKAMAKWFNDSDNAKFRTFEGRI